MALNTLLPLLINRKLIYLSQIFVCSATYNYFTYSVAMFLSATWKKTKAVSDDLLNLVKRCQLGMDDECGPMPLVGKILVIYVGSIVTPSSQLRERRSHLQEEGGSSSSW